MVETNRGLLPALGRIGIVCGVAVTFILGLTGAVYLLSLRNAEVKVPDVLGKNYLAGEEMLGGAGLSIRKRASRFAPETKPDTILDQSPRAGEMIKVGQTIAVVISRPPKEGESAPPPDEDAAKSTAETGKAGDSQANDNAASKNQNTDKNRKQDKDARNKNTDAKSGANANNRNANNRNRNSNNGNANARNSNANNRNASNRPTNANTNRGINNLNANRRSPALQPSPLNSNGNTRRP